MRSPPNATVRYAANGTTQLTYGVMVDPSPLIVSVTNAEVLASIEVVITNPTANPLAVEQVTLTLQVGTGASITQSTAGVLTAVSDTSDWTFTAPGSTITEGSAVFTLSPAVGTSMSLASGAAVVVQIYALLTNPTPGTSTVGIAEIVGSTPGATSFAVTTFPFGFFFDGLTASVWQSSDLVPVAQVATGSAVVLTWNTSEVGKNSATVYYSDAALGQQTATPTEIGLWTSPALSSDTVFTVAITSTTGGGEPITSSRSIAVSVQDPTLVAAAVTTGTLGVSGDAQLATVTASGALSAATVSTTAVTAGSAAISGNLSVQGQLAGAAALFTSLGVTGPVGMLQVVNLQGMPYTVQSLPTDGFAIAIWSPHSSANDPCAGAVQITSEIGTQSSFGGSLSGPGGNYSVSGYLIVPVQQGTSVTWNAQFQAGNGVAFFFFAGFGTSSLSASAFPSSSPELAKPSAVSPGYSSPGGKLS